MWEDVIFVLENEHRNKLNRKFKHHLNSQQPIDLGISNDDAELFKVKVMPFL